jgi:hypothetical protein
MRVGKRCLLSGCLFGCLLAFAGIALSAAAQTAAPNEWIWVAGSSKIPSTEGVSGVYGTLGTPAAGNVPGSRNGASSWTDSSGNLWLFGGIGFDFAGAGGSLGDLWKFDTSTNEWAWMSGGDAGNQSGVYGTLGNTCRWKHPRRPHGCFKLD